MNQPTHEAIALRAYCRWEELGWPHGQDISIWLQAEQQLIEQTKRRSTMAKEEKKPDPVPSSEGFQGEKKLKLKAKDYLTVGGVTYQAGDEFELPEREALGLVGTGSAEELPGDAPGEPTKPDKK